MPEEFTGRVWSGHLSGIVSHFPSKVSCGEGQGLACVCHCTAARPATHIFHFPVQRSLSLCHICEDLSALDSKFKPVLFPITDITLVHI